MQMRIPIPKSSGLGFILELLNFFGMALDHVLKTWISGSHSVLS